MISAKRILGRKLIATATGAVVVGAGAAAIAQFAMPETATPQGTLLAGLAGAAVGAAIGAAVGNVVAIDEEAIFGPLINAARAQVQAQA